MVRSTSDPQASHAGIAEALPGRLGEGIGADGLEDIRRRLGVFLLVVLSTFPIVVPFMFISETALAMRTSNAIALVLLFIGGYRLGHFVGGVSW